MLYLLDSLNAIIASQLTFGYCNSAPRSNVVVIALFTRRVAIIVERMLRSEDSITSRNVSSSYGASLPVAIYYLNESTPSQREPGYVRVAIFQCCVMCGSAKSRHAPSHHPFLCNLLLFKRSLTGHGSFMFHSPRTVSCAPIRDCISWYVT